MSEVEYFCADCPAAERDQFGAVVLWGLDLTEIHCRLLPGFKIMDAETGYCFLGRLHMADRATIENARKSFDVRGEEEP